MVYGDSLKHCTVAIVVVEAEPLKKWAEGAGVSVEDAVSTQNADFKKQVLASMGALATANRLNGIEKPKDIYFTLDAFSVENDILTPTFKLKRNVGKKVWEKKIEEMYVKIGN